MTRAALFAFAGSVLAGIVVGALVACGPAESDPAAAGADLSALPEPSAPAAADAGDAAVRTDAASAPDAAASDGAADPNADALQCMTTCLADDALALKIMKDADACYDACGPLDPSTEDEPPCWQDCDAQIDQACEVAPASCEHHAVCWDKCFPDSPAP